MQSVMPDIALELTRHAHLLQLRKAFEREAIAALGRPPCNEMLNAWLFVQLARSHAAGLVQQEYLFGPGGVFGESLCDRLGYLRSQGFR